MVLNIVNNNSIGNIMFFLALSPYQHFPPQEIKLAKYFYNRMFTFHTAQLKLIHMAWYFLSSSTSIEMLNQLAILFLTDPTRCLGR